jgi:hypothetical protein
VWLELPLWVGKREHTWDNSQSEKKTLSSDGYEHIFEIDK